MRFARILQRGFLDTASVLILALWGVSGSVLTASGFSTCGRCDRKSATRSRRRGWRVYDQTAVARVSSPAHPG
jgi:hypothetical protein